MMIALNIKIHPNISLIFKTFKIKNPNNAPNTASMLSIRDATVGFVCFCPIICKVNPTPPESTPAYRIGMVHAIIAVMEISSKISAAIVLRMALRLNCRKESFNASTFLWRK